MAKKKQNMWKWLAIGLGGVLSAGLLIGVATSFKNDEKTVTLSTGDYAIYALDDTTGLPDKEVKSNLTSAKFYSIDDLECKLAKDASIKYQLNYYSADKAFIEMEELTEDFDGSKIAELKLRGVEYVRIEIIPVADEDGVVTLFEKSGYVNQLTVTVHNDNAEVQEKGEESDE